MVEWITNNWPIFLAVTGWIVTLATDHQKVLKHESDIKCLWASNKEVEIKLAEINTNLAQLNVKIQLLLDGKVRG